MDENLYLDLVRVDRDVARANAAQTAWRAALAKDAVANADREPLEAFRHVAGRTAYLAVTLEGKALTGGEAPLREGLGRWIAHLTLARITRDLDADIAKDVSLKEAKFPLIEGRRVSFDEACRTLPTAPTPVEAEAWLTAAAERAPRIAASLRERDARREEAASRLGLGGTWALATRVPHAAVLAACEELLTATRTVAADVLKDARTKADGPPRRTPFDALALAVARDANEGWPAHLQPRWLQETFPAYVKGLRMELAPLPPAVGASSFARALGAFGFALRVAGPAPSLPFALARDPQHADAHRFAGAFAQLAASREFQHRALGNVARVAAAQSRVVARGLLVSARLEAARVLLARDPTRFEELTTDVFGAALPEALAAAWPRRPDDAPVRALALFTTLPLVRELRDRFDADWFRNPRAALFLRARASAPAWDDVAELDPAAPRALARALEDAVA
jgi:hypothetical protein